MRATVVVIPCFNEAERLDADAFRQAVDVDADLGFLMVDDGSTDGTRGVLDALAGSRPDAISVLALDANAGKAEAVRRGLCAVVAASPGGSVEETGYWDADLATPLDDIAAFRAVLDQNPECLLAMGARVQLLGRSIERKALRHYLGRMFATVAARTLRMHVYDTQCGAKLFRNTDALREIVAEPFQSRWVFDVELLARLRIACAARGMAAPDRIVEIPLQRWVDVAGSKLRARDFVRAIGELWRIRKRYGKGCRDAQKLEVVA